VLSGASDEASDAASAENVERSDAAREGDSVRIAMPPATAGENAAGNNVDATPGVSQGSASGAPGDGARRKRRRRRGRRNGDARRDQAAPANAASNAATTAPNTPTTDPVIPPDSVGD
jgi:hypothetical protein